MDLGFAQAGFVALACVECCETLRTADERGDLRASIIESDIRSVDPSALMCELGLVSGELDLLYRRPLCEAFSRIG
jgi:hypothetical protein